MLLEDDAQQFDRGNAEEIDLMIHLNNHGGKVIKPEGIKKSHQVSTIERTSYINSQSEVIEQKKPSIKLKMKSISEGLKSVNQADDSKSIRRPNLKLSNQGYSDDNVLMRS